ncbi:hypothetical protein [Amycolatopsis minnesotensis]|uniref:Uncharacterized protein n=1 Tax=Amycolatopsis minnesotensis TaxID=337894 RepID=A0ABP5DR67_9PSEU
MSYPPQGGPYPQQPGFTPQQPGFPQPGFPPQQQFPPQFPQGPAGPKPRKERKRAMFGIVFGVLVLVAGLVVLFGFVGPGYFLDKDYPKGAPHTLSADDLMSQFLQKLDAHDQEGAAAFACQSSPEVVPSIKKFAEDPTRTANKLGRFEGADKLHVNWTYTQLGSPGTEGHGAAILRKGGEGGYCLFSIYGA